MSVITALSTQRYSEALAVSVQVVVAPMEIEGLDALLASVRSSATVVWVSDALAGVVPLYWPVAVLKAVSGCSS